MAEHYRLYGGEISYYTGKARAYLRFKGIPFDEVHATRDIYREIILPRVGWPVIPVVVTPEDETLQDTTDIIDTLEVRFPGRSVYPAGPRQRLAALLLEVYGDEWLKIPAMHYRWNHNTDWIIEQFGLLSKPDASPEEAREIGAKTCRPFRGSLPPLGVNETTMPAIEASYEALLGELDAHFAQHSYLFGDRPSIGDFGLIGPLYAHQFRDPASGELMHRLAPHVVAWVERMMEGKMRGAERRHGDRRGTEDRRAEERDQEDRREGERRGSEGGDFLPDDAIPETLMPVLRRMVDEQFPVLDATLRAFDAWADEHPEEPVPRGLGMHAFTLGRGTPQEVTSERACFTFDLWMFQRPRDFFAGLTGAHRDACEALMREIGGLEPLTRPVKHRLARENFRLVQAA
ncbi:MAG: glutathione S-transferase family protein [Pseudomonadales bacterium]|jgi:glutathione S-transferase|nr:glutathione S-transferase family protein [Pseudomonadales bacterium]